MDNETKELIRTEFLAFAMKAFATLNKGRSLGNDKYLELLAQTLTRVATGKTKRLVISMPPRHGKTFMGSICLSAWILAQDASAKILVLSYGQDLADKIAYTIRAILQSDWFEEAFRTRLAKNRTKVMDFLTTDGGGCARSRSRAGSPASVLILSLSMTRWKLKTATTQSVWSALMSSLTTRSRLVWTILKKVAWWSSRIASAKTICPVTFCKRAGGGNSSCH
jgi:hypothetical protein